MTLEQILNKLSMFALLAGGVYFIYEGSKYINMKQMNSKLPDKLYIAGTFTIVLGVISIAFGIWHFFI